MSGIGREMRSGYEIEGMDLDYMGYGEEGEKLGEKDRYGKYGKKEEVKEWRGDKIRGIVGGI